MVPSYVEALKDLLFPPYCLGCERRLGSSRPPLFCSSCLAAIAYIRSPCCPLCGVPFPGGCDHLCGDCLNHRYCFDLARSLLFYQPPVSSAILALKFGGCLNGTASMAALVGQSSLMADFSKPDCVLPVPLHPARLRQRGFNQAVVLARVCFPQWKNSIRTDLLLRSRQTTPQAHLTGAQRRNNLSKVFHVSHPEMIIGKHLLLVDDVFTTGSTVEECSKTLRLAGAGRIEVFTLARSVLR